MPFKSEKQRRYLWLKEPEIAKEFEKATPKGKKLPLRVKKKKKKAEAIDDLVVLSEFFDKAADGDFDDEELS